MFAILFNGVAFTTKHLSAGIETPEETEKSAKKKFLICRTAVLSQWIVEKFSSTRSFFSCVHRHYRDCCCFYFTWTYAVYKSCFYMLIKNNFFISDIRNGMEHLQRIFHLLLKTKKKMEIFNQIYWFIPNSMGMNMFSILFETIGECAQFRFNSVAFVYDDAYIIYSQTIVFDCMVEKYSCSMRVNNPFI